MLGFRYGVRDTVSAAFHRFGYHCANHEIRVILISCVVITSLFYPALAMYWTSKPLSYFYARWLDGLNPSPIFQSSTPTTQVISDLRDFWTSLDNFVVVDDSFTRSRCAQGATVRLERLVIHRDTKSETGALDRETLTDALHVQRTVDNLLMASQRNPLLSCIKADGGNCLSLSPLAFWNFDERNLNSTLNILRTINIPQTVTVSGIPLSSDMTLSSRSLGTFLGHARFLVLTYFFEGDNCEDNVRHNEWVLLLERLRTRAAHIKHGIEPPNVIALQYDSAHIPSVPLLSIFLYMAYIAFFFYFSGSLRNMDTVHSKWGLAFTGLVEIIVSTITSASVCAIVGFRLTMVPWSVLPVVIVFVGAENMFILVDEVVKTPISLPVRERIAVGLSRAGTSNTLKVMTYNAILGTIAGVWYGPIREFCAFAIVVLVAHWFLIHTFFLAVLSIDLQRLELSELLSQDPSLQPSIPPSSEKYENSVSSSRFTADDIQKWMKGRPARNLSLVMLLAFAAMLYYISLPPVPSTDSETLPIAPRPTQQTEQGTPSWQIWSTLNPSDFNVLHLRVESPSIITLLSDMNGTRQEPRRSWFWASKSHLRPLIWTFRIFVLPIAATTGCLYILLLYLLKNTELLDARQHPATPLDSDSCSPPPVTEEMTFLTFPRACATDIRLLSSSADWSIVVTVSVDDEIAVWRKQSGSFVLGFLPSMEVLGPPLPDSHHIRAIVVDPQGSFIAVGSASGALAVWSMGSSKRDTKLVLNCKICSPPVELAFLSQSHASGSSPPSRVGFPLKSLLLICSQSGKAFSLSVEAEATCNPIIPANPNSVYRASFVNCPGDSETWISYHSDLGTIELLKHSEISSMSHGVIPAGNPDDLVIDLCLLKTGFSAATWMAATRTQQGVIALWNIDLCERVCVLDDAYSQCDQMRLTSEPSKPCPSCSNARSDSISLALSIGFKCLVYRIDPQLGNIFPGCTCAAIPSGITVDVPTTGGGSRPGGSTLRTRSSSHTNLSESTNLAPFPVSGHGVHSRRATSEKDGPRASLEVLVDNNRPLSCDTGRISPVLSATSPVLRKAFYRRVAVLELHRGKWDVRNQQLVCIRRKEPDLNPSQPLKQTLQVPATAQSFLPSSVLEKWEILTLDLSNLDHVNFDFPNQDNRSLKASSLYTLTARDQTLDARQFAEWKNLDKHPRLPFTRIACLQPTPGSWGFLVGLGNTIGLIKVGGSRSMPNVN